MWLPCHQSMYSVASVLFRLTNCPARAAFFLPIFVTSDDDHESHPAMNPSEALLAVNVVTGESSQVRGTAPRMIPRGRRRAVLRAGGLRDVVDGHRATGRD